MAGWRYGLDHDPVPLLLGSKRAPLAFFVKRDILGRASGSVRQLWTLPEAERVLARQTPGGSWRYPGGGKPDIRRSEDYDQLETYRQLGILVEEFAMDRSHPAIRNAARFLFAHQTEAGDFRGIYGRQCSPNYSAGIAELLVKAGYGDDVRIDQCFRWLLRVRQDDGGWAIPWRTRTDLASKRWTEILALDPIEPDRGRPSSHLVTGVVLRAFAAHSTHRHSPEARRAGEFISGRFFKPDSYSDRRSPSFWKSVSFPFWFTDVVSALDSLSHLGFRSDHPGVRQSLSWLASRQTRDGTFRVKLLRTRDKDLALWVCLAICRVFMRFEGDAPTASNRAD